MSRLLGSSPRVRSGRGTGQAAPGRLRIISACAERTSLRVRFRPISRDHLRVCGADSVQRYLKTCRAGSSPRVRSGPVGSHLLVVPAGIISACAERTSNSSAARSNPRDHLRVCGADSRGDQQSMTAMGSSPRVRSGRRSRRRSRRRAGIISACAERTHQNVWGMPSGMDHLRVCGADVAGLVDGDAAQGSSPRVRSGRGRRYVYGRRPGIISACAERTPRSSTRSPTAGDHLRVCGADSCLAVSVGFASGSSPRVRSGRASQSPASRPVGIISACAERTRRDHARLFRHLDHLRVCGADAVVYGLEGVRWGSSPRVRSGRRSFGYAKERTGIISACAERTSCCG